MIYDYHWLCVSSRVTYLVLIVWHIIYDLPSICLRLPEFNSVLIVRHFIYEHHCFCLCHPEINTVPLTFDIFSYHLFSYHLSSFISITLCGVLTPHHSNLIQLISHQSSLISLTAFTTPIQVIFTHHPLRPHKPNLISGSVLSVLTQFLSNRSQYVVDCLSKLVNVVSGVPQGSVLGHQLFFLYTAELFSIVEKSSKVMLATSLWWLFSRPLVRWLLFRSLWIVI